MPRTNYAIPIDVVRRFDPSHTASELRNDMLLGDGSFGDEERLNARIEGVEADFEARTGTALRQVRVGTPGSPATYDHYDNKYWKQTPSAVYLDHRNILPFDSQQGDAIELRVGIDRWRDVTPDEGERWVADYKMGKLELYSRVRGQRGYRNMRDQRFIRMTYRYGALGGDRNRGGETTLTDAFDAPGDVTLPTTLSVDNAARLPPGTQTMLLDGEYVRASADPQADTVTIATRGERGSQEVAHDSGGVLHYCPVNVREAIAAQAARELVMFDGWADRMVDEEQDTAPPQTKLDGWESEYEQAVGRYTEGGYH